MNSSMNPCSNLFLWVLLAFRLIIPVELMKNHRKNSNSRWCPHKAPKKVAIIYTNWKYDIWGMLLGKRLKTASFLSFSNSIALWCLTCIIILSIKNCKHIGICSSIFLLPSLNPQGVCCWHGCEKISMYLCIFLCIVFKTQHVSTFSLPFCSSPKVAPNSSSSSFFFMKASSTGTSSLTIWPSSSSTANQRLQGK